MSNIFGRLRGSGGGKRYALKAGEIKPIAQGHGGCIATDAVTVEGRKVGYMVRDAATYPEDSGWSFFAGDETREYLDDPGNSGVFDVNTIANYDEEIVPFLDAPVGSRFIRWPPGSPLRPDSLEPERPAPLPNLDKR